MTYYFQVTVDSADPHVLADWWAETLGWEVEPSDEAFIRDMIAQGFATDADTQLHNDVLVWRDGAAILAPGEPASPSRRRVLFQLVPEPKTVKNRVHLDVRVGADNVDKILEELQARGATFLHRANQGPHSWVTVADPEGNEFCIT
jgi:Glyoxalase-like domain